MVYKWMKTIDIKGRVEKSSQKNKKYKVSNTEKITTLPAMREK